ncbi:hypothetical protein QAD02_019852 [Eretmocerus hayati]|uniref:Uncharacterized protein n=1 Tax=Eretmocerus hayati TaxID=131215 RepID=A0ACC2PQK4_9HYME|nr:hypothetical protein QAD02_019852 [Eretmocerus hayati]
MKEPWKKACNGKVIITLNDEKTTPTEVEVPVDLSWTNRSERQSSAKTFTLVAVVLVLGLTVITLFKVQNFVYSTSYMNWRMQELESAIGDANDDIKMLKHRLSVDDRDNFARAEPLIASSGSSKLESQDLRLSESQNQNHKLANSLQGSHAKESVAQSKAQPESASGKATKASASEATDLNDAKEQPNPNDPEELIKPLIETFDIFGNQPIEENFIQNVLMKLLMPEKNIEVVELKDSNVATREVAEAEQQKLMPNQERPLKPLPWPIIKTLLPPVSDFKIFHFNGSPDQQQQQVQQQINSMEEQELPLSRMPIQSIRIKQILTPMDQDIVKSMITIKSVKFKWMPMSLQAAEEPQRREPSPPVQVNSLAGPHIELFRMNQSPEQSPEPSSEVMAPKMQPAMQFSPFPIPLQEIMRSIFPAKNIEIEPDMGMDQQQGGFNPLPIPLSDFPNFLMKNVMSAISQHSEEYEGEAQDQSGSNQAAPEMQPKVSIRPAIPPFPLHIPDALMKPMMPVNSYPEPIDMSERQPEVPQQMPRQMAPQMVPHMLPMAPQMHQELLAFALLLSAYLVHHKTTADNSSEKENHDSGGTTINSAEGSGEGKIVEDSHFEGDLKEKNEIEQNKGGSLETISSVEEQQPLDSERQSDKTKQEEQDVVTTVVSPSNIEDAHEGKRNKEMQEEQQENVKVSEELDEQLKNTKKKEGEKEDQGVDHEEKSEEEKQSEISQGNNQEEKRGEGDLEEEQEREQMREDRSNDHDENLEEENQEANKNAEQGLEIASTEEDELSEEEEQIPPDYDVAELTRSHVSCGHVRRLLHVESTAFGAGAALDECWHRGVSLNDLAQNVSLLERDRGDIEQYDLGELYLPCERVFRDTVVTKLTTSLLEDFRRCEREGALTKEQAETFRHNFFEILQVYEIGNASLTIDEDTLASCRNISKRITMLCRQYGLTEGQWSQGFLRYGFGDKWAVEEEISELSLTCDHVFDTGLERELYDEPAQVFLTCLETMSISNELRDQLEKKYADELLQLRAAAAAADTSSSELPMDMRSYVSCKHVQPVRLRNGPASASWIALDLCKRRGQTYAQLMGLPSTSDGISETETMDSNRDGETNDDDHEVDVTILYLRCKDVFNDELWSLSTPLLNDYESCKKAGAIKESTIKLIRKRFADVFKLIAENRHPRPSNITERLVSCEGFMGKLAELCRERGSSLAQELRGTGSPARVLGPNRWINAEPLEKLYVRCDDVFDEYARHLARLRIPIERYAQCRWAPGTSKAAQDFIEKRMKKVYVKPPPRNSTGYEITELVVFDLNYDPNTP